MLMLELLRVGNMSTVVSAASQAATGREQRDGRFPRPRSPNPRIVRQVWETLEAIYGRPRFGNPQDPLDDLVYIILSNKTSPEMAVANYERVKQHFPTWDDLLASESEVLRRLIKPGGLSTIKSNQIRAALSGIAADFRSCTLNQLRGRSVEENEKYLVSLPGVSKKVAKCILMYTMEAEVLPVDAHVHRITRRLGWVTKNRADQCHDELETLVPPSRRYAFHVGCIAHGRLVCRPKKPSCDQCCINQYCEYFRTSRVYS